MLGRIQFCPAPIANSGIDLVIFDPAIADRSTLLNGLKAGAIGVTLSGGDPIAEIGQWLQRYAPVRSLHLVSHGRPGGLQLGDRWIEAADLQPTTVGTWREWLTDAATISLYGCEVARDHRVLPERLARLTGASVAASRGLVGATAAGGNWLLDVVVGTARSVLPWSRSQLAAYPGVFATIPVSNATEFQSKLDTMSSSDIISLTNDIVVSTPLLLKASTTTIYGNGYAITGTQSGGSSNHTRLMHYAGAGSSTYANLIAYDLTFRGGSAEGSKDAYYTALNTNGLNFSGSKIKFEGNNSQADYSDGSTSNAIGAAIYGGGEVNLADSSFSNNYAQPSAQARSEMKFSYFNGMEFYSNGSIIYAIGGSENPVRLIDTTFSNNYRPSFFYNGSRWDYGLTEAQGDGLIGWSPVYATNVTGMGDKTLAGTVARPQLSVSSVDNPVEGVATRAVNFTLDAPLPYPLEFNYTIDGVSYTSVFPHSTSTYSSWLTIPDDNLYNPGRTTSASVNTGRVYTIGTSSATINITDDEPLVGFASSTASLTEGGSGTSLTLSLNKPAPRSFAIGYSVSGTATSGDDFSSLSGNVSVSSGATSATIPISSLDDPTLEGNETIVVTLTTTTNNYGVNGSANTATVTLADNEVAPTANLVQVQAPSETGSTSAKFKIELSEPALQGEIQSGVVGTFFNYTVTNGTATQGTDYGSSTGQVFIPKGSSSATIEIPISDDVIYEAGGETFTVQLSNHPTGLYIPGTNSSLTLTIEDDELVPVATVSPISDLIEAGQVPGEFQIDLSSIALNGGVTIDYEVASSSTTTTADYATLTGSATIAEGETQTTVSVVPVNDIAYDPDEQLILRLKERSGELYTVGSSNSEVTLTFVDNEVIPVASITKLTDPTEAGSVAGEFQVDLSSIALEGGVTIDYEILSSSTATSGDYAALSGSVTIPAGETRGTVSIDPIDDIAFDPNEQLILRLKTRSSELYTVSASNNEATFTFVDNEIIPIATLQKLSDPNETGEVPGEFKINLASIALEGGLTVSYDILSSSTTTAPDYAALSGSVTFPENTTQKTIQVVPDDDGFYEPGETLVLKLRAPGSELYTVGSADTITLTIADNEHLYTVRLTPEADAGENGTLGYFLIELDQPALDAGLTVNYTLSSGDAIANADYVGLSGSVTVAPGETQARIRVEAIDNAIDAPPRDLELSLSPAAPGQVIEPYRNYTADSDAQTATIAIADNDTAGVRLAPLGNTTNETGTTAEVEIRLESQPTDPVTIDFISSQPNEGELVTTSVSFSPSEWKTAKTVTVQGIDDSLEDGDQPYRLTPSVSSSDPAYDGLTLADLSFTNLDDDGYTLLVSTPNRITEGGVSSYTLALTQPPSEPIPIEIVADDQAEVSLDGSTFAPSVVTNRSDTSSQTVFVRAIDDSEVEGRHTSTVTHRFLDHTDPHYPSALATTPAIVTIEDNDSPIAGIVKAEAATEASVVAGRFGVVLDQNAPAGGVTIGYQITAQTATSSTDYTTFSGSLFIPEGATGGDIIVNPVQDSLVETGGETITVALLGGAGYSLDSANISKTVSIFDDDIAGVRLRESGNASRVRENVSGDSYTLELTSQPSDPVTIALNTSGDITPSVTSVSFDATNWNQPQTVLLPLANNNISEGDRTQIISHSIQSDDANYDGMTLANVNVAIVDDDTPGMVMAETGFSTRVSEGLVSDSYTLVLESQPIAPVTVTVNQASDSGLAPIAPLVFNASNWNTPQTVTVAVVSDFIDRDDRATTLTHTVTSTDSVYNGWVLEDIDVAVTEDDNASMTLTESGNATEISENAFNDSYVVALTSQPVALVTVTVAIDSTSNLDPIAPLVFQPSEWNVPQTVAVTLLNDNIDDDDRSATYRQTVTSSDPKYNAWTLTDVVVPITEDDVAGMVLTQSGGTTEIAENAFDDSYTISLTSEPTAPVTVAVAIDSTSNLDPVAPLVFQPAQWQTPQTVNVTLANDDIDDDDRSAIYAQTVTSGDPKYDGWFFDDIPVPISEDDLVGFSIRGTGSRNYVIEGSDNPDFLEVILNSQPTAPVTIAFDTGTELEPISDLVVRPEDWQTVFSIPFFAKQDTEFEATETLNLAFTVTSADRKYDPTGGLADTITAPAPLVVEVADRQLLGSETAAGLGVVIDRFATLFETNLRKQYLPSLTAPIGQLIDLSSTNQELVVPNLFLFKDQLLADLAALGATDATTGAAAMEAAIRNSFAKAGINAELTVTPGVSLEELTFDIGIRYSNPFETKLNPNLGLDELKFDLDGTLKGQFDAQLNFGLGWNERFGFFIDSQKTKLDTHFNVTPPPGFAATGSSGLLSGKATNDPQNPTKIDLDYDLSLVDLDDVDRIRFLDVNSNGSWDAIEPLVEEVNGSFPNLPIFGRFDLNNNGIYDPNEGTVLATKKPDDATRLTLTEILENATHPNLANGTFSGVHNLGLKIDTAIPGLRDAPIPRFLFTLDSDWENLTYDATTDLLKPLTREPIVNFQNFGMDVSSLTGFIMPIFDIVTPLIKPFDPLLNFLELNIAPGWISKIFSTFDIGSIAGIDVDPFNLENFLKGISNVNLNIGEFTASLADLGNLPSLVANLPTGFLNFGSFGISGPDLPKLDLNLPSLTLPRLPNVNLDLGSLGLPAVPGNFDISQFNRSKSIKFPILTDPMQALYLVLGKEDVTLATLETPSLTGSGYVDSSTGIFQSFFDILPDWVETIVKSIVGRFGADINASFLVHAGLGFGFDTLGLYKWAETDFDPNQADRILDGFFVSDRLKPDGTGPDIKEIDLSLALEMGFTAGSLLSVSGKGKFGGELKLDLYDPDGDGKVRFYSEILPQLPYINRIIGGHGSITAAGSAKLEIKVQYPSFPDFWNLDTWSKTLYTLKIPQTTLAQFSVSQNGVSFGTAFDGPMEGSDVFFDANFNGVRDALEPSTITFGEGDYNLEIPLDLFDRNGDGKIDLTEGQIVVEKGTDTDTFQPQRFPFLTAPEWTIASPLTALALRLAQPNLAATEISLERAFALPSGFDLQADSPFIAIENGDRNGVTVLVAQGQLQNLLILGANALQAKDDRNGAANAIMAQVSQRVQSGAVLNLTDPAQVQAILNAAAQTIGASADLSEIVTEIQSRNQAIIEASGTPIEEVRAAITDNVALEAIDPSYFTIAVEPWAILLRTSQPVPPLAASSQRVLDLLDLPSFDLATFDPFANLDNYKGVEVLTRQIQLNATLTQIADIAIGAGVENAETKVFDAIIAALQSGVQLDDLSNPEIILSVLKSVTSPGAAQRMAEIIAASNANFTTIATTAIEANNFETVRDNLVESQIIVQYLQSQLLKAISAGEISINQFDQLMELNQTDPNMKTVIQNIIEGSDGNDTLVGTPLNDWIAGRGGDDLLQGQAGDDQLYGNAGVDQLEGDTGNDYLFGGVDNDQLDGGEGDDLLDGGEGDDLLDGGEGDDNLVGGSVRGQKL